MTEPKSQVSLDDVRVRFMEAETKLSEAGVAIASIQMAAERLGAAKEGLGTASQRLAELASSFGDVAASLTNNAEELRLGVDAIKAGDPAEIKRQIEELDSAFTAMQSVVGERMTQLDAKTDALSSQLADLASSSVALEANARRESRIIAGVIMLIVVAGIAVSVLVP